MYTSQRAGIGKICLFDLNFLLSMWQLRNLQVNFHPLALERVVVCCVPYYDVYDTSAALLVIRHSAHEITEVFGSNAIGTRTFHMADMTLSINENHCQ